MVDIALARAEMANKAESELASVEMNPPAMLCKVPLRILYTTASLEFDEVRPLAVMYIELSDCLLRAAVPGWTSITKGVPPLISSSENGTGATVTVDRTTVTELDPDV